MTPLFLVGASKFAVDVCGFLAASLGAEYDPRGYLAVAGEELAADPARTSPFEAEALRSSRVVVAVAEPGSRARLFAEHREALREAAITVIHPTALLAPGVRIGVGTIVGPHCYVGTNARLGDLNVLNYHVGVGHHSELGDCNFLAPGFQCGNSAQIGNGNFFGLSCTVGPGVTIGNDNLLQAGSLVTQSIASNLLCFSSERLKALQRPGES